jgi:hypothetical protein
MNATENDNSVSEEPAGGAKKGKKGPVKHWTDMTAEEMRHALARSVHYSSKIANTNAEIVGVRLGAQDRPQLPFIAFSTIRSNRRLTDYIEGGAPGSVPFSQCASVIEGVVDEVYLGCSDEQKKMVLDEVAILDTPFVLGDHVIDPRLRQLLMPTTKGHYVSLTPLPSALFSVELLKRAKAEWGDDTLISRKRAILLIGGTNSQNAGRHIFATKQPLVFDAPRESLALRKALAIHHLGVTIESLLPRGTLQDFIAFREANALENSRIESNVRTRKEELRLLNSICSHVLASGEKIGKELDFHKETLGSRVSDEVDDMIAGLIDPVRRHKKWSRDFAIRLLDVIESYRPNKKTASVAQAGDLSALISEIEGAI